MPQQHGDKMRRQSSRSVLAAGSKQVRLHPLTLAYVGDDADELEAGIRAVGFKKVQQVVIYMAVSVVLFMTLFFVDRASNMGKLFATTIIGSVSLMGAIPFMASCLKFEVEPGGLHFYFHLSAKLGVLLAVTCHVFLMKPNSKVSENAFEELAANGAMVMVGNVFFAYYLHGPFDNKVLAGIILPLAHTFRPMHGLGTLEARIIWMSALVGQACGYALERAQRTVFFEQQLQLRVAAANRKADSRLNHVVKGLCGGANGLLESLQVALKLEGTELATDSAGLLEQVREMLGDASEWCHRRQLFVHLEAGTYESHRVECALSDVLKRIVGSDGMVESVSGALLDTTVLTLAVQEGLSNARKYRSPTSNVRVKAELIDARTLHVSIDSLNQRGLRRMSDEECKRAFMSGSKFSGSTYMSDGVGLDNVAAAIAAASGTAWLSTSSEPDGDHTIFHVTLPAEACSTPTPTMSCSASETSESGDSTAQKLELEDDLARREAIADAADEHSGQCETSDTQSAEVISSSRQCHGDGIRGSSRGESGIGRDVLSGGACGHSEGSRGAGGAGGSHQSAGVSRKAKSKAKEVGRGLCCIGVDDCHFLRAMHLVMFETFIGADMSRSNSVGANLEEALALVDIALGRLDSKTFAPKPQPHVHADVVVIDQNMTFRSETGEPQACVGTDLAARLQEGGFTGVTCILSGSSRGEIEHLSTMPGVDMTFEKSASLNVIGARIRAEFE